MSVVIDERPVDGDSVGIYSTIPISFRTDVRLRVQPISEGRGGFAVTEERLDLPIEKDYDAVGERPMRWLHEFDVSNWRMLLAFDSRDDGRLHPVGGLVLAHDSPQIRLLDGRRDMALVWDLRVRPESRGRGVGTALMERAKALAKALGCTLIKVETQDLNIAACRFYESVGFRLGGVNRYGYWGERAAEGESMMLYYMQL